MVVWISHLPYPFSHAPLAFLARAPRPKPSRRFDNQLDFKDL